MFQGRTIHKVLGAQTALALEAFTARDKAGCLKGVFISIILDGRVNMLQIFMS